MYSQADCYEASFDHPRAAPRISPCP
jgi:hypothetical protein